VAGSVVATAVEVKEEVLAVVERVEGSAVAVLGEAVVELAVRAEALAGPVGMVARVAPMVVRVAKMVAPEVVVEKVGANGRSRIYRDRFAMDMCTEIAAAERVAVVVAQEAVGHTMPTEHILNTSSARSRS
jgi:hypothetical protein